MINPNVDYPRESTKKFPEKHNSLSHVKLLLVNSKLRFELEPTQGVENAAKRFNPNKEIYEYLLNESRRLAKEKTINLQQNIEKPNLRSSEEIPSPNKSPRRASYFLQLLEERQKQHNNNQVIVFQKTEQEQYIDDDGGEKIEKGDQKKKFRRVNSLAGHDWKSLM